MADPFMSDQASNPEPMLPFGSPQVMIGRWSVARYVTLWRWPVILDAAVVVALLYVNVSQPTVAGVELLLFIILWWLVARRNGGRVESVATGLMAGAGLGLIVAIARLLIDRALIYVLNVVAETMLTALIGGLITVMIVTVKKLFIKPT